MLIAMRGFAAYSRGAAPTVFYFGGLDTLRGYDYRSIIGNNVFYVNTEFRFPLIDLLATPVLQFGGIRGRVFLDVGGAWLKDEKFQFMQDGRPQERARLVRRRVQRLLPGPPVERGLREAVGFPLDAVQMAVHLLHRSDVLEGSPSAGSPYPLRAFRTLVKL